MKILIIIVAYKTKNELESCLDSIYQNTKDINFEIAVIDNNSQDSTTKMIEENYPKVILVKNKQNLGFAKAVNQGLKIAKGDYYFLLNPDTEITKNALKILLDFAKNQSELGAVGPKLLNPDRSAQASCYNLPSIRNAIFEYWFGNKGAYEKYLPRCDKPVEVEAIVGAAMLIPKKAVNKVGLFDERYFMYFEDLDWCRRARRQSLKIYWHPAVEIIHSHGVSASRERTTSIERLQESSRLYNGFFKNVLLTIVIFVGEKLKKLAAN